MVANVMKRLYVLFDCHFVNSDRMIIQTICRDDNIGFNLQNLMTLPCLQLPVERLLLTFLKSSK